MDNSSRIMMHSTYFKLEMGASSAIRDSYMETCRAFLSGSKGMMSFWVGEIAEDMNRPVNDKAFHIAMNQMFESKAMFDIYNGHDPRHDQFVEEVNRWAVGTTRRVQDSYLHRLDYAGDGPSSGLPIPKGYESKDAKLMHSIYFALNNNSRDEIKKLIDICNKCLSGHHGTSMYAVGELADMGRDVSVTNYDVQVSILWQNKSFYDAYLKSPEHDEFFVASEGMIKDSYVFDSYLQGVPPPIKE